MGVLLGKAAFLRRGSVVLFFMASIPGCSDSDSVSETLRPCDAATMAGAPVIALDWDERIETHLAPGTDAELLVFDYFVFPQQAVNFIQVRADFDLARAVEPVVMRNECPRTMTTATLLDWADNEVISAEVLAGHDASSDVRKGRVTVVDGDRSMRVDTTPVNVGEPWWFVFEPGRGSSRVVLLPAPVGDELVVEGLPRMAATVALIQSDDLIWDAENQVAYSPPGFAAEWRSSVSSWHGNVILDWQEGEIVRLSRVVEEQGIGVPSRPLQLGAELNDSNPSVLLRIPSSDSTGTLTAPCDGEVELRASGFVDVAVDAPGGAFTLAPGESETVFLFCSPGDTRIDVSITGTVLNGRTGFLVAQLRPTRRL